MIPQEAANPIDAFVLARLDAEGLKPAPRAGKRTLIRRATIDLTGLPPSPEEVDTFLKDESPEAFAKMIDRLLASPDMENAGRAIGSMWRAMPTIAFFRLEDKAYQNSWRYRNWVIAGVQQRHAVRQVRYGADCRRSDA